MMIWVLLLVALWVALQADLTVGAALGGGLVAVFCLVWLGRYLRPTREAQRVRFMPLLRLGLVFAKDLVVANALVLRECLRPKPQLSPAVIVEPIDLASESLTATLANMVTLTPGTLSLEALENPKRLVVHGLFVSEEQEPQLRESIQQYAKLLREASS